MKLNKPKNMNMRLITIKFVVATPPHAGRHERQYVAADVAAALAALEAQYPQISSIEIVTNKQLLCLADVPYSVINAADVLTAHRLLEAA